LRYALLTGSPISRRKLAHYGATPQLALGAGEARRPSGQLDRGSRSPPASRAAPSVTAQDRDVLARDDLAVDVQIARVQIETGRASKSAII
jgi:hypothetical protein